jgi:hypothetical protein
VGELAGTPFTVLQFSSNVLLFDSVLVGTITSGLARSGMLTIVKPLYRKEKFILNYFSTIPKRSIGVGGTGR